MVEPATYSNRYVAFLDILGFAEIVKNSEASPVQVGGLLEALNETRRNAEFWLVGPDSLDIKWTTFSDSIVMSAPETPRGLDTLLSTVDFLSFSLLCKGLPSRGGVARGPIHHDSNVIFGPAFLAAYDLEKRVAKFPRIIVGKTVYSDYLKLSNERTATEGLVTKVELDDDGPAYIDILDLAENDLEMAKRVKDVLQKLIDNARHEPEHFVKIKWLAMKWNAKILPIFKLPALKVIFKGSDITTWRHTEE